MEGCTIWLLEVLCIFSTLMIVNTSVNTSRHPNVKNTTQSSTYSLDLPSCKTVDGCTTQQFKDKCCSHTAEGQHEAWWQIDLEGPIVMEYVKIYYRVETDEQRKRFGGYQIYQSNTSDWRYGYLCHKDTTLTSTALSLTPRINCTGAAQYLTIYNHRQSGDPDWYSESAFLELCEVEVYGCPLGKYGNGNCDSDCDVGCSNRLCDPETGRCLSCTPWYYGSHCNRTCLFTCKDNQCIQGSGECGDCEDGFYGSFCDNCSVGCTNHGCDHITGNCSPCKSGYYGDTCNTSCPSHCERDICNQTSGICTECKSGFYGDDCKQTCPTHCHNSLCERSSGNCSACLNGFYGSKCDQSCPAGCNNDVCTQSEGICTVCEAGYYSSQCLTSCGKCQRLSCDMDSGECTSGCTDGWTGTKCDTKVLIKTKWDAAVGIGIGSGVVIVVLVIGIIVLVRRRKVKRSDTTVSSHMADISLSRSAKELNKGQDNTYDAIATQNKEHTSREISTNEANYEQLVSREVEIPHVYETTDDVKKT